MSRETTGGRAIARWGIEHVGCGYIYGATGWRCTPERRRGQAEQYPQYADMILGQYGAQWDGKVCYDCAQYTKQAVAAAGGRLPSGVTSQWSGQGLWDARGEIGSMPDEVGIMLYVQDKSNASRMNHVGIYIGNGETAEAQGTRTGCVRLPLSKGHWTHWARHVAARGELVNKEAGETMETLYRARVATVTDGLNMRAGAGSQYNRIGTIPQGAVVEVLDDARPDWWQVRYDERVVWVAAQYLARVEEQDALMGETVELARADAQAMLSALSAALEKGA